VVNAPWRKREVKAANHEHIVKKDIKQCCLGGDWMLENFGENEGRIGRLLDGKEGQ